MYLDNAAGQCKSFWVSDSSLQFENYWVFGLDAYSKFTVMHDMDNARMGFISGSSTIASPVVNPGVNINNHAAKLVAGVFAAILFYV